MGRTLVAEEGVKNELAAAKESQKIRTGLLLGQVTESKDFIISAVPTPSLQELGATEGTETGGTGGDTFADWWVVEHAKQVCGLLPGGINVVGVFICCPSHSLPALQARFGKILADIAAGQEFKGHQPHQHLALLHYCFTKKKFKCQTINLGDAQAGFRPAEIKFKSHVSQWCKVEAVVSLDVECVLPVASPGRKEGERGKGKGKEEESRVKLEPAQARAGLSVVLESLQDAVVTLRGQLVRQQSSTPLLQHGSKKSKQPPSPETIPAALYLRKTAPMPGAPAPMSNGRRASLKGSMVLLAYLHPKATCAEAIAAVKQDACRSLLARVQALVEAQNECFLEQLPVRVALSSSSCHFPFTEFSLPHEDTQECVSRASELLGATPESMVATPLEQFAGKGEELAPPTLPSPQEAGEGVAMKRYYGIASILASISAVLIAASVWIILQ